MHDLQGKRVTVMGLGRFGGGIGVSRWLAEQGADVLVTDLEKAEDLVESVAQIRDYVDSGRINLRLGEHNVSDFTTCDLVVASPAVPKPWDNRFLRAAQAASIPITTEMRLVLERLPNRERLLAVTGSVGKSTTTAMIAHALERAGQPVALGGNIGGSLLASLPKLTPETWVVLELSSFMLYWLESAFAKKRNEGRAPRIAVLTNIASNHLDWHASMTHYETCKKYVYEFQEKTDAAVFGPSLGHLAQRCEQRCVLVEPESFNGSLALPGAHNIENAASALAACRFACPDIPESVFIDAIGSFGGLPHRLQLVREVRRVGASGATAPMRFYNDSKSTTPESALRAIEAIADMPGMSRARIHLIAGGYDKKADLSPVSIAAGSLAGMYAIGATGPSLAGAAPSSAIVHDCETLAEAFDAAMKRMRPGDALLLSPACASWDQYKNYEERGDEFIRLVKERVHA